MEDSIKFWTILENHYYSSNGSAIKYSTRNICADSTAKILEELAKILFPDDEIEIYVIPAQDWCHQDNFWIKIGNITNNATVATISWVLLTTYFAYPLVTAQIELAWLESEKLRRELNQNNPEYNITNEQYNEVFKNNEIKKNKNKHFEQLRDDKDIIKEKIIAKQNNKIIFEKTIHRENFIDQIETIENSYTTKVIEKIHHLTVVKPVNEEEHKDLVWEVEDINGNKNFWIYMCDEEFYSKHLAEVLWLKSLIARVKYTFNEDQDWNISKIRKEIILVYKYNQIELIKIPVWEEITPAPLEILNWEDNDDWNVIESVNKSINKKEVTILSNQIQLFEM